jgi:hypothetical protein
MSEMTLLPRAFELARSGDYPTVQAVRRQLKAEGFAMSQIDAHLSSRTLVRQLSEARRAAS